MHVQNLLPMKEEDEDSLPASSEPKLQTSCSVLNVSMESGERRRRRHSGDQGSSTRGSSPGSERSVRAGLQVTERLMRAVTPASDHVEQHSTRESSPVSERCGSQAGTQNTERALRDRASCVGSERKERSRLKRETSGTVSSSASTCSEDSEPRINDFLGKHRHSLCHLLIVFI